jgi:hypothetical protein
MAQDDLKLPDDGERYPNLKEKVGGSIPDREFSPYLTENFPGGQLPPMLCILAFCLKKKKNKKKKNKKKIAN